MQSIFSTLAKQALRRALWAPTIALCMTAFASAQEGTALPGHIVVERIVPPQNPFRARETGQASLVATSREDLVIASTKAGAHLPQVVSDAALGGIGSQMPHSANSAVPTDAAVRTMTMTMGEVSQSVGGISGIGPAFGGNGALQSAGSGMANIGATVAGGIAPLGAALSTISGGR